MRVEEKLDWKGLMKNLAGKRFVTDVNVKQAVTSQPQELNTCSFHARIQALVSW
jgi:hypothetical protein